MIQIFFYNGQRQVCAGEFKSMPATQLQKSVENGLKKLLTMTGSADVWCLVAREDEGDLKFIIDSKSKKVSVI
jgi:hypothetical protein